MQYVPIDILSRKQPIGNRVLEEGETTIETLVTRASSPYMGHPMYYYYYWGSCRVTQHPRQAHTVTVVRISRSENVHPGIDRSFSRTIYPSVPFVHTLYCRKERRSLLADSGEGIESNLSTDLLVRFYVGDTVTHECNEWYHKWQRRSIHKHLLKQCSFESSGSEEKLSAT